MRKVTVALLVGLLTLGLAVPSAHARGSHNHPHGGPPGQVKKQTHNPGHRNTSDSSRITSSKSALAVTASQSSSVAASSASSSTGNRGTVKIHAAAGDAHPHNQPHVSCRFAVAFFGFDPGTVAQVTFDAHPPTGRGQLLQETVTINADPSDQLFDLSPFLTGFSPHPKQGTHVKLTVLPEGARGAGKHKVFWVKCPSPFLGQGGGQLPTERVTVTAAEIAPMGGGQLPVTGSYDALIALLLATAAGVYTYLRLKRRIHWD